MWQHTHRAHAQTYVSVQTMTSRFQKLEIPEFHDGGDRKPYCAVVLARQGQVYGQITTP